MKRRLTQGVALVAAGMLALSACGGGGSKGTTGGSSSGGKQDLGFGNCEKSPNTCNSATGKAGGTMTYTIEKNIDNWNVVSSPGNTFDIAQALWPTQTGVYVAQPDLSVKLNEDLMVSAQQTSTNPQVLTYKIKPNAVWSDGQPIDESDFEYLWKTEDPTYCKDCEPAGTGGYDQIAKMEAQDNGKTVVVTMKKPYTDWQGMFGILLPAHIAKQQVSGDLFTPDNLKKTFNEYFEKTMPTWSAGPYVIASGGFKDNVSLTVQKNPKYYGKAGQLDTIVFRIITDASQEPTALQNGEVQGIYPQPQVDLVSQVKAIPDVNYHIGSGLIWEHFDLNLKNSALADKALRQAMFTAVDRNAIISKTVGQFASNIKPINSHNFVPGQNGYKDVLPSDQGSGNVDKAKQILQAAGYTGIGSSLKDKSGKAVGPFRMRYTTGNKIRANECDLFKSAMQQLGITVNVSPTDSLGDTLDKGDFDVIVFAWVGTPFVFSGAQQIWTTNAGGNYGKYSNPQVDQLLNDAAQQTDAQKAIDEVNQADTVMSDDAYVLPLYQKPTFLAVYKNVVNIRDNPTNQGPVYNINEWAKL